MERSLISKASPAGLSGHTASAADTAPQLFSRTLADDLQDRMAIAEGRILVLTASALYRFQPESEAWTVATTADGLPGVPLRRFALSGLNLWVTGDGASVSDARLDDWQHYGSGEGYPGRIVFDVEADLDYAYAGTDEGAARFDQYILEWETLDGPEGEPLGPARDVAVGADYVWFALDRGVAEYRKESESFRIDTVLGQLQSPRVLALRQTTRYLWAFTDAGIARYDKDLQSWTSFQAGVELPDARVRQAELQGDDLWLGTDQGLWSYRGEAGIWRRDESNDEMPGGRVLAFALDAGRIWAVTERAFAIYEEESARWIDFTSSVPLPPRDVIDMLWTGDVLMLLSRDRIVYGLSRGRDNPSLFTYRSRPILKAETLARGARGPSWSPTLDEAGLGLRMSSDASLYLKGGGTIFVENDLAAGQTGLGDAASDTRLDIVLSGKLGNDRTLSGFYDSTDPDNSAYQLTYRGARSDILRVISGGEIDQQLFNSTLAPGTGLRGGRVRAEFGTRTEVTRRRFLNADAWVGERRTLPGRDVFYGGNRTVEGSIRDLDYVRRLVFPAPGGWLGTDLQDAAVYLDDGSSSTDNANTEHRAIAGRSGAWDRLRPNVDYVIGPGAGTLILAEPLAEDQALAVVRRSSGRSGAVGSDAERSPADRIAEIRTAKRPWAADRVDAWESRGGDEADLTDRWLRNHYLIAIEPVPGSFSLVLADTTGSLTGPSGRAYTALFGLDFDGDGLLDPERFSPITGLLCFPDELPFPAEVYADDPKTVYTLEYSYQTSLNVFQLSRRNVVPGSERVTVDRILQQPDVDYSLLPTSGLFVFFEHVLLDEDTVIEVEYQYELDADSPQSGEGDNGIVVAGQVGLAPNDHVFWGANSTRWHESADRDVTTTDVNARLEWKDEDHFVRLTPELAWSHAQSTKGGASDDAAGPSGTAAGVGLRGRYQNVELSASHRNLGANFASFEDRRTLLGRLREESNAWGRLNIGRSIQAELEWEKSLSDELGDRGIVASEGSGTGAPGVESPEGGKLHPMDGSDSSPQPSVGVRSLAFGQDQSGFSHEIDASDSLGSGLGEVSSFMAGLRLLHSGLPNIKLRRGKVLLDGAGNRQEKWISRAELELSPDQAGITPWGIQRLWLRAFFQRSERELTATEADTIRDVADSAVAERTTDHLFTRFNGTVGSPLSWNLAFEDRRTHIKEDGENRDIRRLQGVDATLHSQPHSSLDAFLRWESNRNLFRQPSGESEGFDVRRLFLATIQLYPGRLHPRLSRLSVRVDLGGNDTERGEPGVDLPGAASLWRGSLDVSRRRRIRNDIVEARVQILSWMRLVERWETESDRITREGLTTLGDRKRLENRLEMRPRMGFVALRFIGSGADDKGSDIDKRRFLGQWDQRWGRGVLTYMSLEAHRTETWDRSVGDLTELWNPLAQITWRSSRWRLDASVGGSLGWTRSKDISHGVVSTWTVTKRQSVTTSLSIQPLRILSVKLDYALSRNQAGPNGSSFGSTRSGSEGPDSVGPGSATKWETQHDLRLRIQIRA